MLRTHLLLGALPYLLMASCASSPSGLRMFRGLPVTYQGRIAMAFQEKEAPPRPGTIPASALKMDGPALEVEARLYAVDKDALTSLLGLTRWSPVGYVVDRKEASAKLQALLENGWAESLSTPRIVSWSDQEARVSLAKKFSYVKAFLLKQGRKGIIADPQVGTLRFSTELLVKAAPSKEKNGVDLQVKIHLANPPGPLPAVKVPNGFFPRDFTIQTPLLFFQDFSTKASLEPGRAALITGLDAPRGNRGFLVLLWARIYPAPAGPSSGAARK